MSTERTHPMKVVVRRTGLSPHVIRMWERRYGVVSPLRTTTNRRRYVEADIERLQLLRRVTQAGWSIGQVAALPAAKLTDLIAGEYDVASRQTTSIRQAHTTLCLANAHLETCLTAVQGFNVEALEMALMRAGVALSQPRLLDGVVAPLLETTGEQWRMGALRIVQEHLVTASVRTFLGHLKERYDVPAAAPYLVVATPLGQMHELGALMVACIAAAEGWRPMYLGANLPAEEIAAAVHPHDARAVALSIIYPADDPRLGSELRRLHRALPPEVGLIVGGRSSLDYQTSLEAIEAVCLPDLASLRAHLASLRSRLSGPGDRVR